MNGSEIFDPIRKKWLKLLPEELVRQSVICHLHHHLHVPYTRIVVERGLKVNRLDKRYDISVLHKNGNVQLLIECKSPSEKLNQQSLNQIGYYNTTLRANIIWLTNGHEHLIYSINHELKTFEKINALPPFN